jgi:hypothetical protein
MRLIVVDQVDQLAEKAFDDRLRLAIVRNELADTRVDLGRITHIEEVQGFPVTSSRLHHRVPD